MGHPEPFDMKFIGVGNEQWGEEYVVRLAPFIKAIRKKYPDMKIIGSSGPSADGKHFDYLWPEMKKLKVDLVDEHYYKDPKWFLESATRYDSYDRKGPAVFAGEYACHMPDRANSFQSALYEAAFMTGLERNADIVHMCTYAPLLAHVDGWQWRPDLIWFDNLRMLKTPNYYIQQLYGKNAGTHTVSLLRDKAPLTGQDGLYASAAYDASDSSYIVKIVNVEKESKEIKITLDGLKKDQMPTIGDCTIFQSDDFSKVNTLDNPNTLVPQKGTAFIENNIVIIKSDSQSFGVYRILLNK